MCGIVGFVGHEQSAMDVLLDGQRVGGAHVTAENLFTFDGTVRVAFFGVGDGALRVPAAEAALGADLSGIDFRSTNLEGASLLDAKLSGAYFPEEPALKKPEWLATDELHHPQLESLRAALQPGDAETSRREIDMEIDGVVKYGGLVRGHRKITVHNERGGEKE